MTKKFILLLLGLFAGFIVIDMALNAAYSNSTGPPAGYTGSPADGKTCGTGGCHGGGEIPITGCITSNIPASGYVPGSIYTVSATITHAGVKFGFEISPQALNGTLLGSMALINTATTKFAGTKYITHTVDGTSGNGSRTWSFLWTAPYSGTGEVTFYGAFNATNNNFGSTGDTIYTSSLTVQESTDGMHYTDNSENTILIFPNPSSDYINIVIRDNQQPFNVNILNAFGEKVVQQTIFIGDNKVSLEHFKAGQYFVSVYDGKGSSMLKRIIKN